MPLHEWTDEEKREGAGDENLITWLFEEGSFVPTAKIVGNKAYSIITDYLGTPTHAFDSKGDKIWKRELDIYGKAREGDSSFIPFLFQGQYFDEETNLCYNRFRYYSPDTGNYISQDLIGLAGDNPTLYGYTRDTNILVDILGLIVVYRFDQRTPMQIKANGGFMAKVPNANVDLYDYAINNTPSQYISTSVDLQSTIDFANRYYGGHGYIYKIDIPEDKGIFVNDVLGNRSPFPEENEFAVLRKIPNENISGYVEPKNITDSNNVHWKHH